jgi:hypothetical protein
MNYLTDKIRHVVRREVLSPERDQHKLFGQPRIFNDLLSSQPLCFNLFGELQADLALASRVFRLMTDGRVSQVTAIAFEHSPGRGDLRYTGDRSAFDVYVAFTNKQGAKGFAGIEVKYHEDLTDQAAPHRKRYDEIADAMGEFKADARDALKQKPLQQIWRDHMLAGSLLLDHAAGFADGFFVFLHPRDNDRCAAAVARYRACLTSERSFEAWTLEAVVAACRSADAGQWIDAFHDRYLAFGHIDALLASTR